MPNDLTVYEARLRRDALRRAAIVSSVKAAMAIVLLLAFVGGLIGLSVHTEAMRAKCERRGGILVPDPSFWSVSMICVRAERLQ